MGPPDSKGPPLEVYDDNNEVTFDIDSVLHKWAKEYSQLYSPYKDGNFDEEFYAEKLKEIANMGDPGPSDLDIAISILEIRNAVSHAKSNKAVGIDGLPYEVFKNEQSCILLEKLFNFIYDSGYAPSVWLRALLKPIPQNSPSDLRLPLVYRG